MGSEKVVEGPGHRAVRVIGKIACAVLLLLGLMVVGAQIDLLPYVGSGRLDVFPRELLTAPLPAFLFMFVPPFLIAVVLSVSCVAAIKGRFLGPDPMTIVKSWAGWFLAIALVMSFAEAQWWWPLDARDLGRVLHYAARCAAVAAMLLTGAQWLLWRYANWGVRPQTRWREVALWFVTASVLIVGFSFVISLFGGLSAERLVSEMLQGVLIFGGLLALAAALLPRPEILRPSGQ